MDTLQWASVKEEGLNYEYFFRVFRAFRGLNDLKLEKVNAHSQE